MKYLLDVNALVALGFQNHEFHGRVSAWIQRQPLPAILTCSITELGFVRVLSQVPMYGFTVAQARILLLRWKKSDLLPFTFIADDQAIDSLPSWASSPRQTTDGHLSALARANAALLATLDGKIPGAYLIR
jgi:predicted nucleic acid-binding protein